MSEELKRLGVILAISGLAFLGLFLLETTRVKTLLDMCTLQGCPDKLGKTFGNVFAGLIGAIVVWSFLERQTFKKIEQAVHSFAVSNLNSEGVADAYRELLKREGLS